MGKIINIIGQRFTRLIVESLAFVNRQAHWNCLCDCGQRIVADGRNLRSGNTNSCGCYRDERARAIKTKHGHTSHYTRPPEYTVWCRIKQRCENPKCRDYRWYGARGIRVSPLWRNSFPKFFEDMGPRPPDKQTIERIDNDGNYEPGNCKWATWDEQRANKRAH